MYSSLFLSISILIIQDYFKEIGQYIKENKKSFVILQFRDDCYTTVFFQDFLCTCVMYILYIYI